MTNTFKLNSLRSIQMAAVILLALAALGCSGSSGSSASDIQSDGEIETVDVVSAPSDEPSSIGVEAPPENIVDTDADSMTVPVGSGATSAMSEESTADDITQPEPIEGENNAEQSGETMSTITEPGTAVQSYTDAFFEITVPAYQSNELQVRLIWGEFEFNAGWVGDEYWSASASLPTDTMHLLTVSFYDENGAIEIARFEQAYRTGVNDAETYSVTADQFDSTQFDDDGDGLSNFNELVAGTDPTIDEDSLLPVRDVAAVDSYSQMSVSEHFEGRVSGDRPFFRAFERPEGAPLSNEYSGSVVIDAQGNGTLTYNFSYPGNQRNLEGTRTYADNTVLWEGTRTEYDSNSYRFTVNFSNTVSVVDENTRSYVEEMNTRNEGTHWFRWVSSRNLVGKIVEGSTLCIPVAGTVFTTHSNNTVGGNMETTISKEMDDEYWRVVNEETTNDGIEITEYFARELRMRGVGRASTSPETKYFKCDFVDF